MSINPVGQYDALNNYNKNLSISTAIGAGAGVVYGFAKPGWLYKGMPSDTFVKQVSKELKRGMTSDELKEAEQINKFLFAVVEPETDLESLKPMIKNSKELSNAIKSSPSESIDEALARVYSNPDKDSLRKQLLNLQNKTFSDKKSDKNSSLKLIYENFDAKNKTLVKSENTTDSAFSILKKAATKVKAKSLAVASGVAALIGAAAYLIVADVPENK